MSGVIDSFRLDGKVAWVTGASYGLGMAYAMAYAEAGARVVFNSSNRERVEKAIKESAKELQELGFDNAGNIAERILLARKKVL